MTKTNPLQKLTDPPNYKEFLTLTDAAEVLGTTRYRIWYIIKSGYWKPEFYYGRSYFVQRSELPNLKAVLDNVGTRAKVAQGKFLRKTEGESASE